MIEDDDSTLLKTDDPIRHSICPLDLVESFLRRFVAYPSEHALVAHVLWIAHCHLVQCFDTTPRLAFMTAEKASGKTRALEVTQLFVPNPKLSFSISAAALVRIISQGHEDQRIPRILFDEIDNLFARNEEGIAELRGALNSGYRRGAMSTRCINKGAGVAEFPCFAPLAVAGLRTLPDTLASRAIFVHMRRRAADEVVESFRNRFHPDEARPITEALAEWCLDHEAEIGAACRTYRPVSQTATPMLGAVVCYCRRCWKEIGQGRHARQRCISPGQPAMI